MIILAATTSSLEVFLGGAVSTTELPIVACYVDVTTTTYTPGASSTATNGATDVTAVAAPGSDTQRQVKFLSIRNVDTAAATVTLQYDFNGTERQIIEVALQIDDTLLYTDGEGFRIITGNGNIKTEGLSFAGTSDLANVAATEAAGTAITVPRGDHVHGLGIITTQGDILTRDGSGPIRLGTGTDGQVLTSGGAGANLAWEDATGGSTLVTGSYTGDGATSQEITGLGITPKLVWIIKRSTSEANLGVREWLVTTDTILDDNANGMAVSVAGLSGAEIPAWSADSIIALAAGSFTVDDDGADADPNASGIVYNFWALG